MSSPREAYRGFIDKCRSREGAYRLTPLAEPTAYATCFAIFGLHLLEDVRELARIAERSSYELRKAVRAQRRAHSALRHAKPYRQLLAFVLSALAVLGTIEEDPLRDLIEEQLSADLGSSLEDALGGRPQSGNHAMFTAVFLLHAQRFLGMDVRTEVARWVDLHLKAMNRFGLWGSGRGMTHLAFQNGYHQYEIFEYLGVRNPRQEEVIAAVRGLADEEGHFAPYPGGGGCYDYDAAFILTPEGRKVDERTAEVLCRLRDSILREQRTDGGFAESLRIRPRSWTNFRRAIAHVGAACNEPLLFTERLRQAVTLLRPKHDRIQTHWSCYSRRWDEANLWDSWFRMLTLARIEVALDPSRARDWGFIDYPGIGFHWSLRGAVHTAR